MSNARNIANLPNGDDAPLYVCRAWVNFDGTTNTAGFCTIRNSGNVSTVADNGTGNYTVNFTTAMPDENYVVAGISSADGTNDNRSIGTDKSANTSGSFRIYVYQTVSQTLINENEVHAAIFR